MDDAHDTVDDFGAAFEWACAFTNLKDPEKSKIMLEIKAVVDNVEPLRKAAKLVAPLLPPDLVWHGAGPYLLQVPTLRELQEDEGLSRVAAKAEQLRLKALCEKGRVMDLNSPKHVAETFAHLVMMKAYALGHWRGFKETAKDRPYLMLDAINDSMTPKDCLRKDGKVYRVDDPYWSENPVPCGRAFCRCSLRSLSEREAKERSRRR